MALVFKRILMITHNVQFAIDTKRALESLGDYEVTTVTDAKNAIDRLQAQAHHIVLIDVENLEIPPLDMIKVVRATQNDIAIILAPDLSDVHDIAGILNVQGVVDIPAPVRSLIPVFEQSANAVLDSLPDTIKAPAVDTLQETVYIETLVDDLLGDDETPYFTSRQIQAQKRSLLDSLPDDEEQRSNTIEFVVESEGNNERIRYAADADESQADRAMRLFQRLAQEEPPMPSISQSGTVSDLARNLSQSKQLVLTDDVQEEEETEAHDIEDIEEAISESIPAILVLQTALNETTPVNAISLKTLHENIQSRLPSDKQTIRPLPSWLKESEKFIQEPVFLSTDIDYLDSQRPMEYTSTNTQASDGTIIVSDSGNLETEVIESGKPFAADELVGDFDLSEVEDEPSIADEPEASPEIEEDVDVVDEIPTLLDEDDVVSESIATIPDEDVVAAEDIPEASDDDTDDADSKPIIDGSTTILHDDPYVAQLAVTLTQVTTELTAEATVLTRDNTIVAYSGDMPIEDIEDVRSVIKDDWSATSDNARIRFITLPSSGTDYMLYSKGTIGGFTLSMLFIGTRQLRVIRRQGERLLNALEEIDEADESEPINLDIPEEVTEESSGLVAVPEIAPDEVVTVDEPVDIGPKSPYTFILLTNEIMLSDTVAKQLVFWMETQLNSLHWTTHKFYVRQDMLYLYADVPGDLSPATLVRNLKDQSEKIVQSEDETLQDKLWTDAYLVLTPGRDMTDREIQRFLNFARNEI